MSSGVTELTVNSTNPLDIRVPQTIAQSTVKIYIWRDFCPRPIVRVRLVGPELRVFPPFILDPGDSLSRVHVLEVDVQNPSLMVGVYKVEATLIKCNHNGNTPAAINNITTFSCRAVSEWNNILNFGSYASNGDGNYWAWVHSPKCEPRLDEEKRSPECAKPGSYRNQADYVFMEMNRETKIPTYDNLLTLKDGATVLSKPTSLSNSDESSSLLKSFSALSNYELVCWLGDVDAQRYWRAFMDLYPLVGSTGQRPFKFKYIMLTDTSVPTKDFSDTTQMTYDKCKIFFVSYGVDRFAAGVTPETYGKEVETLLAHIEKSHPDSTYPAWFLSPRSSTSFPGKTYGCGDNNLESHGRTPDQIHKFNELTRQIFRDRQLVAPQSEPRIRFMDNSDITETFWHILSANEDSSNMHVMETQITAAVAMRCMEKIAQQVKEWRSNHQIGTKNGLMKNGKLIPNEELFKKSYTWGK